jgi:hypothetical protein
MAWANVTLPTDSYNAITLPTDTYTDLSPLIYVQDQNGDFMQTQDGKFVETQESLDDSWTDIS